MDFHPNQHQRYSSTSGRRRGQGTHADGGASEAPMARLPPVAGDFWNDGGASPHHFVWVPAAAHSPPPGSWVPTTSAYPTFPAAMYPYSPQGPMVYSPSNMPAFVYPYMPAYPMAVPAYQAPGMVPAYYYPLPPYIGYTGGSGSISPISESSSSSVESAPPSPPMVHNNHFYVNDGGMVNVHLAPNYGSLDNSRGHNITASGTAAIQVHHGSITPNQPTEEEEASAENSDQNQN